MNVPMGGVDVMLAIPAGRDFDPLTVRSLVATFNACNKRGIKITLDMVANSSVIQWARDEGIDHFLKSQCNVLFMVDSDMVWEPEQFIRLLVLSQLRPVVCAAYPAKRDPTAFFLLYDQSKDIWASADELGLLDIQGVGLGFTVIRREVIEKVAKKAKRVKDAISGREMASMFRIDSTKDGDRRGEDIAFFADIRNAGYKVLLDPSIDLGHVGRKVYRGSIRDALKQ